MSWGGFSGFYLRFWVRNGLWECISMPRKGDVRAGFLRNQTTVPTEVENAFRGHCGLFYRPRYRPQMPKFWI